MKNIDDMTLGELINLLAIEQCLKDYEHTHMRDCLCAIRYLGDRIIQAINSTHTSERHTCPQCEEKPKKKREPAVHFSLDT